jgi:flagellin
LSINRINNNISALNTVNKMTYNWQQYNKSVEKLASGERIVRAGDDAAGLAISEKLRAQVKGLNMAARNAQDAVSLVNTAEGALNETSAILQRLRELSIQAANDTLVSGDRSVIQVEVNALVDEIDRIAEQTEFNTQPLLDTGMPGNNNPGAFNGLFHIGANKGQTNSLTINPMGADDLAIDNLNVETQAGAETAIEAIDSAIFSVSAERAAIGQLVFRMEVTINNLTPENTQASESRIRDVDMATEMLKFTKFNILMQSSMAMLAQANQLPNTTLQLLR